MQLIHVLSASLTAGVPYNSAVVEYWKYHGVIKTVKKHDSRGMTWCALLRMSSFADILYPM